MVLGNAHHYTFDLQLSNYDIYLHIITKITDFFNFRRAKQRGDLRRDCSRQPRTRHRPHNNNNNNSATYNIAGANAINVSFRLFLSDKKSAPFYEWMWTLVFAFWLW